MASGLSLPACAIAAKQATYIPIVPMNVAPVLNK